MGKTKDKPEIQRYGKVINHPDYDEIVGWIKERKSVQYVLMEMKKRYPDDKSKQFGQDMFYRFRVEMFPEYAPMSKKARYSQDDDDNIAARIQRLLGKEKPETRLRQIFTDDQILSWGDGVDGRIRFIEDMMFERGEAIKLQGYQRSMVETLIKNTRVCVNTGAQVGKDFMIDKFSVSHAILNPFSTQLVLCAVQDQSLELMRRTLFNIKFSEDLSMCVEKEVTKPPPTIYFKNGSRIVYFTAQSLVAGYTNVDIVWINEARDVREEDVTRASPLLGVGGGSLYVLSRPRFRRGYFWECYNNPRFENVVVPTTENKYFDREVWESDQATLSPDLFKIEYLAQFADVGSSYISELAIDLCSKEDWDWKNTSTKVEPDYNYSVGIDWARLRDTSVFTVLGQHKTSKNIRLFHIHAFSPDRKESAAFENQFSYLAWLNGIYNFTHVVPESSGMGIPLAERLVHDWRDKVKHGAVVPYENRSFQAKLEMYEEAKRQIETYNVQLPRSAFDLITQLKMTQIGTTATGSLKVETPITDDYGDSFCLAMYPFKKPFKMGIGVLRRGGNDPMKYIMNPKRN